MKQPYYKIGDKVTFERKDGSTVTITHVVDIIKNDYIINWYNEQGRSNQFNDHFDFSAVDKIRKGKHDVWKITKVISQSMLPEDLFHV